MGRKPKKPNLTEEQKSLIIQEFIAAGITKTENGRLTDRTAMKRICQKYNIGRCASRVHQAQESHHEGNVSLLRWPPQKNKRCMGRHQGWLLAHRWNSSAEEAWQTRSW